jgi:hypothetical protein
MDKENIMNNTAEYMREFREKKRKELEAYREKHCIEIPVPAGQRKVYVDVGKGNKKKALKALPDMMNAISLKLLSEEDKKEKEE